MTIKSKILYVDDDRENLTGFEISLSRSFGIVTAENSQVAYSILKSTDDVGVVLVDYKMPTEDGISFVDRIKDEFPDLIYIITSAWADMDVVIKAMNMNCFYGFLQKPWNYDELRITLKNALEHFETRCDNKRLNAELLNQNRALQDSIKREKEANRVKNVFLQNISHEIRTPLNSIIGFSSLIKQNVQSDNKVSAYSDLVIQGGYELLKTIHNILESAVIFSNQVVVNSASFDVNSLVKRLVGEVGDRVVKKKLTLHYNDIDEIVVVNDELKVQHILKVLLDNAIKFTSKGSISISTFDGSEISEEDNVVVIRITDTGIGIRNEDIEEIFNPFKQVDDSNTRHFGGNGIGLFIAKSYAELLGGSISVESEPNRGSVFSLVLKKDGVLK